MSYGFYDEQVTPLSAAERLERDVLDIGIRPEVLTDLSDDDARFVLGGMAKLLATITHPDRGQSETIMGLDAADINAISARIRSADDQTMEEALSHLANTNIGAIGRAERKSLMEANEQITTRSLELVHNLLCPEQNMQSFSGRVALGFSPKSDSRMPELEILDLAFVKGEVVSSIMLSSTSVLASTLEDVAQRFISKQRPNLDDSAKWVYIDEKIARKTGLPVDSWCQIITAKGKKDPSKKQAAVKIFDPASSDASDEKSLVGSKLFGKYISNKIQNSDPLSGILPQITQENAYGTSVTRVTLAETEQQIKQERENAYGTSVTRVTLAETEQLMVKGFIEPIKSEEELNDAGFIVLRQPFSRISSEAGCYIVPGPLGLCQII
ncbi:MAG: hypothetical protein M3P98_02870 [bacterium]|nr:hypothetical protein [bacterium]